MGASNVRTHRLLAVAEVVRLSGGARARPNSHETGYDEFPDALTHVSGYHLRSAQTGSIGAGARDNVPGEGADLVLSDGAHGEPPRGAFAVDGVIEDLAQRRVEVPIDERTLSRNGRLPFNRPIPCR
jgi:hypothetical protein